MERSVEWQFHVEGMRCAGCASSIEKAVRRVAGVLEAEVNFGTRELRVRAAAVPEVREEVLQAVSAAGYQGSPSDSLEALLDEGDPVSREADREASQARWRFLFCLLFAAPIMGLSLEAMLHAKPLLDFTTAAWILLGLSLPVQTWGAWPFYRGAWSALRHRRADMNTLIALGTAAAFLFSLLVTLLPRLTELAGIRKAVFYETAVMIVTVVLLGRWLEARARARTTDALSSLMRLRPRTARVQRDGKEFELPVQEVRKGDLVAIRPGESVPIDGVTLEGESQVDESMVTGESLPVSKKPGAMVIGGTVNGPGFLLVRAEKEARESLLAQIIRTVREAQGSKPPVQRLVDRIASIFVPVVVIVAMLSAAAWYVWGPPPEVTNALVTAVAVLIVACPCALGLATPTALIVGAGRGAREGVLFKNAETLEKIDCIDTVVFDKTGTLTLGRLKVQSVRVAAGREPNDVLQLAASVEAKSEHPIARAIVEAAQERHLALLEVRDFVTEPGRGACGRINDATIRVGNVGYLETSNVKPSPLAEQDEVAGATSVLVSEQDKVLGRLELADQPRPEAKEVVAGLRAMGLDLWMLSGDRRVTAEAIAREVGIEEVHAEVLPTEKSEAIRALQRRGRKVAMVGDGINDAPALAQAELGIAMGGGTDVALQSAGVALLRGDLEGIAVGLRLGRFTLKTIRMNLLWAIVYNAALIPLAAGVFYPIGAPRLDPMLAAAAMALSSVFVVANSLRLRRVELGRRALLDTWRSQVTNKALTSKGGYETIEHTGDIGIRVWAETLAELFRVAAEAFTELVVDRDRIQAGREAEWLIEEPDLEQLLNEWLTHLNRELLLEGNVYREFEILEVADTRLKVRARGEPLDSKRHDFQRELKAVTFHGLYVRKEGEKWEGQVIFDV